MKYKDFDRLIGRGSANNVMLALQREAYDMDTLGKELSLDRTSVFYHLKILIKKGIIEKRMVGKKAYYGLIKKKRTNAFHQKS